MIWAQGYSEPGAGSNLASLMSRATLEGDHFVLRGHKIWTTWAHHSDWMYALLRTDPQAQPRQAGISFLLIDLHSPGVKVRPINTITGDEEFSEVFLDDVVVPGENLVGKLNDGWRIANALLGHERLATANPQFPLMTLDRIKAIARATGVINHPAFQHRLAAASIMSCVSALFSTLSSSPTTSTASGQIIDHQAFPPSSGAQRSADRGSRWPCARGQANCIRLRRVDVAASFHRGPRDDLSRFVRIQRNILARRVLNLPMN